MQTRRIHIMGASGAGTTTLGRALATALAIPHHDTDDYFWRPTNPPFRRTRPREERLRLMREMFVNRGDWVLSGSLDDWGQSIVPLFDLVVFIQVPTAIRLQRLRLRETRRFGDDAVGPGGWRHAETEDFLAWAAHYDDASREGRNLPRHLAWLKTLRCCVQRLDGTASVTELVANVTTALNP
jgi:adenylate kinase family enzyme